MHGSSQGTGCANEGGLTRRNFLIGAALAGTGMAAGLAGCSSDQPSSGGNAGGSSSGGDASKSGDGMNADSYFGKWSFEVPDAPITDIAETVEADIVVVGAGTGGLTAVCLLYTSSPS